MIRTKHLTVGIGVAALLAVFFAVFGSPTLSRVTVRPVVFSVPSDAYPVAKGESSGNEEHRAAFIASVRSALERNPVQKSVAPVSDEDPKEEEIQVAVPSPSADEGYTSTPALLTTPAVVPATTSTSTQE